MKNLYIVLCVLLCTPVFEAQASDSLSILGIYDDFQTTVINKDIVGHTSLFVDEDAPVYNIKKEPTGPEIQDLFTVNFWTYFFSQPTPYELEFSEIEFTNDDAFAITEANYDEYIDDELNASGKDLIGYIKTEDGWKIAFVHNTVVSADDETDYSEPFELVNTIEEVIDDFVYYFNNQNGDEIVDLFVDITNQLIVFEEFLPSDYDPENHDILDFSIELSSSIDDKILNLSNYDIHIVDDYVATVFCDYTMVLDEDVIESGRAYFNFIADIEDGWKLTSFIRNNAPVSSPLSVKNEKRNQFSLYPNPAQNTLSIKSDIEVAEIEIFDGLGRLIENIQVNNINLITIDVSNYNSGLYFVNLRLVDGNKMLQQLIIE